MIKLSYSSKKLHFLIAALLLISCREEHTTNRVGDSTFESKHFKNESTTQLVLNYVDSIISLPKAKFNDAGIKALNKTFSRQLPLVLYDSTKNEDSQDILIQCYKNNDSISKIHSGVILLLPKSITESISISDFTGYFGSLNNDKPLLVAPAQPLPVQIDVSENTSIKLSFNKSVNLSDSAVIMVDILRYR